MKILLVIGIVTALGAGNLWMQAAGVLIAGIAMLLIDSNKVEKWYDSN